MLKDSFGFFESHQKETQEWFSQEIGRLRTGRITPDIVTAISVEAYGSKTPLNGLASVSNTDAHTLVVSPWDPGSAGSIVQALQDADLGATPSVDGAVIRLTFPALTEEIREQTVRLLHKKTEEARVRLRQARDEALKMIKEEKEAGNLTEDDFYAGKEKLDAMIANFNKTLELIEKSKESDITTI